MKNVEDVNCTASFSVVSVWIKVMDSLWLALVDMLQARISEFTQKDGRKKRTAKHLCVTNMTGL